MQFRCFLVFSISFRMKPFRFRMKLSGFRMFGFTLRVESVQIRLASCIEFGLNL
jgi:hypothetical protein